MAKDRIYVTADGEEIRTHRVSPMALQEIERRFRKVKPRPPLIEVLVPGSTDKTRQEHNFEDPMYKEDLAGWEEEKGIATLRYVYAAGTEISVPPEVINRHLEQFGEMDDGTLKYLYVSSLITTEEETNRFIEFVLGQNMVTPGGIQKAEERFHGNGGQPSDIGVEVSGASGS